MRKVMSLLALVPLAAYFSYARAQETEEDQQQVEVPEQVPEQIESQQEQASEQATTAGATQAETEHTVVPGDTLWDLCAKYLNNPWYWPRVWSYNPEITNPHWIYPGQMVRFYPTGELPSEMLVAGTMEVPEPVEAEEELEEIPSEELVSQAGKYVQARAVGAVGIQRDAFVTSEEVDELGKISGSKEEKEHLAELDSIYIEFKDASQAQVGNRYSIVRTMKKVYHPITKEFRGYYTRVLGAAQVVAVEDKVATAVIVTSLDPIHRGDRIAPWVAEFGKSVVPKANGVELKGYIMDARLDLSNLGERHVVFIDQGSKNGVEEGNVFDVVRREDGYLPMGVVRQINVWDKKMPMEIYGRIMIVDARPTASTGIVLYSLRELNVGDRVMMSVD